MDFVCLHSLVWAMKWHFLLVQKLPTIHHLNHFSPKYFFQEKWGGKGIAWVSSGFSWSQVQWEFGAPESCPDLCLQVLKFESLFNLDSFRYLLVQLCCTKLRVFPSVCCLCSLWWCFVLSGCLSPWTPNTFWRMSSGNMWSCIDSWLQFFPLFSSLLSLYL